MLGVGSARRVRVIEGETLLLFLVLLVGITIIASILIKAGLERIEKTIN